MGVLNVTPDSFSDGGAYLAPADAAARLAAIRDEGAAICDVGAESTRPGSESVPPDEQLRRLAPILEALERRSTMPVSIDTSSAAVAAATLEAGAVLVNDVTAGRADPDLLAVTAERNAAICLVHMLGEPKTMQQQPRYGDVVSEVRAFLEGRLRAAVDAGIHEEHVLVDPGIGFGKRLEDNLALLRALPLIGELGRPVVVGVSRKSMLGALLGRDVADRTAGSVAAGLLAADRGAAVLRVHDVRDTVDALGVWTAMRGSA